MSRVGSARAAGVELGRRVGAAVRRFLAGRSRRFLWTTGCAALTVVVLLAGRMWFTTRDASERTATELGEAQDELAQVDADLAAATAEYDAAQATLLDDLATLGVRRDERDAAQEDLATIEALLDELQAELSKAKADLNARSAELDAFNGCLTAVVQVLNQLAVRDTGGLGTTLPAMVDACAAAGVAL